MSTRENIRLIARTPLQICFESVNTNTYDIPINDTTLELSVFWPSDTESRINELRFTIL